MQQTAPITTYRPNYCNAILKFAYDTGLQTIAFVVLGIAAQILYKALAPAFYTVAISTLLGRIIFRIIDAISPSLLDTFKDKIESVSKRYHLLLIIVAVAAIICPIFKVGGIIIAAVAGILHAVLIDLKINRPLPTAAGTAAVDDPSDDENEPETLKRQEIV